MKRSFKSIIAVLLAIVLILLMIPLCTISVGAYSIPSENEFAAKIAELQSRFVDGKYWNKYSASDYSHTGDTPCPGYGLVSHVACSTIGYCADYHGEGCSCYCGAYVLNGVEKAWQCMGFAYKMGHECFGVSPYNWDTSYSLGTVCAGDIVRINGNRHSIFVYKVEGSTIYYADCNRTGPCRVSWGNTYSYDYLSSILTYKLHLSGNTLAGNGNTGNNPQGVLDGVSGGAGTVTISGWAFDKDDLNAALEIHVYIGGRSGNSNAEGHGGIIANAGRGDVNAVFGCGDYHGFSATISTNKRGSQPVYVYALNVGGGDNVQIGEGTVNITSSGQPQITALYLSEKKKDSYRVCAQIDRPADVREVRVATWTTGDQSDLKWTNASYNGFGTYFVDLSRSDFTNNQRYINHVYVYDYSGNSYSTAIDMNYTPPVISDVVISQVSIRGMRVSCKVEGETSISRVSFPTWPAVNGNPIWHEATNFGNGYFSTYISASEHNNPQSMAFHIYAYDAYGSESSWGTGRTQITDDPMEFSSIIYKNNKYIFYNTALSWEDASKWCEDNGGHLVTIKDQDEWNAISDLLKQANGARCWLGANSKNGDWKWVTGEKITFDAWDSGQPDNAGGIEYYLGTYSSDTTLPERSLITCYNWNDFSSEYKAGFICEFENTDFNLTATVDNENSKVAIFHNSVYGATNYSINIYNAETKDIVKNVIGVPNQEVLIKLGNGKYFVNITTDNGLTSEDEYFTINKQLIGDTNLDGIISISDVTDIQRHLAELIHFSDEQLALADTDGNGVINIADATRLQMYLAEYEVVLGKQG